MQGETGSSEIAAVIRAKIAENEGRITFADFMEAALYHPQLGYYQQPTSPIGPAGDFYTAVSATPILGRILAGFFQRLEKTLECATYVAPSRAEVNPPGRVNFGAQSGSKLPHSKFGVLEFGGHRGKFRDDVLAALPGLDYRVVELGDPMPAAIDGCVFSNEFLDALPVHRVKVVGGKWMETYVAEGLRLVQGPLSDPRLGEILAGLPVEHMEGYETEVNLRALDWMADIGQRLRHGYVVTIDYGFEWDEFFAPQRSQGTLRCYHRHKVTADPLERIGEQDITAHVEWSSLMEAGRKAGLETVSFSDLSSFLIREGADVMREVSERTAGELSRERQGIQQLLHVMGTKFQVLVQRKAITST